MDETKKYYAVRTGRTPGIYESWTDCKAQIDKYKGAVFKAFTDKAAAEAFLQPAETTPINKELPTAYIDGSYSKKQGVYGYGGYIEYGDKIHILQGTGSNPEYIAERNIAGELIGTLAIIRKARALGLQEINLVYDYAGIENYLNGSWKAKTPLAMYYEQYMDLETDWIKYNFVKVAGHTGIEGNELADYLAKEAVGAQLRKKDIEALKQLREKAKGREQDGTMENIL